MPRPKFTDTVRAMPTLVPFVGPEAQERRLGAAFSARLGANESPFGPSAKAVTAMQAAAYDAWTYADPENFDLRTAIAQHHGVARENVVIGEGIDGLLGLTVRLFVGPGDGVVTSDGAYPTFNFHVASLGGHLIKVPYVEDREDLSGLCRAARQAAARLLYVSNPDNPMGSWWQAADLIHLREALPEDIVLILDEAYADTAPDDAIPAIDCSVPNVIRYRTFSKAYGLAGARVGYALAAPEIISAFDKVRNHYGVNRLGLAGALAALKDQSYLSQTVTKIAAARRELKNIAVRHGLAPLPSAANFVAIDCGGGSEYAAQVLNGLLAHRIFVRRPAVAPLDRCIRVSVGRPKELSAFETALSRVLDNVRR